MQLIKDRVLEYMKTVDTEKLSTNNFIWGFIEFCEGKNLGWITKESFNAYGSAEGIARARRSIIKTHGLPKRINADSETDFINEYCVKDRYKNTY